MQQLQSNDTMYTAQDKQIDKQILHVPDVVEREVLVLDDFTPHFHYHEFTTDCLNLVIVRNGEKHAYYDKREITLRRNDAFVILPNHLLKELAANEDYHVTIIALSPKFLEDILHSTIHRHFIRYHYDPVTSLTDAQAQSVLRLTESIREVSETQDIPHRHDVLIHLVDVLLTLLNYYRKDQNVTIPNASSHSYEIYNRFCDLLVRHHRESHEVSFYAEKLHLTPKHFSKVIYDATGHHALFWIEQHIVIQAKQMLHNRQDLSIQEICFDLGFSELANFSRYFKRVVGCSPRAFREDASIK